MQPTTFLSRIDVRYLYFVSLALTLKTSIENIFASTFLFWLMFLLLQYQERL